MCTLQTRSYVALIVSPRTLTNLLLASRSFAVVWKNQICRNAKMLLAIATVRANRIQCNKVMQVLSLRYCFTSRNLDKSHGIPKRVSLKYPQECHTKAIFFRTRNSYLWQESSGHFEINIEGRILAKREVLENMATKHQATVVMVQETHQTNQDCLKLTGCRLTVYIFSARHGIAVFVKNLLPFTTCSKSQKDKPSQ